jgi:hypothetical protein
LNRAVGQARRIIGRGLDSTIFRLDTFPSAAEPVDNNGAIGARITAIKARVVGTTTAVVVDQSQHFSDRQASQN